VDVISTGSKLDNNKLATFYLRALGVIPIEDHLTAIIPDYLAGKRLDQALAELFPEFSRSRLQKWLKCGFVLIDGKPMRPRETALGGELVKMAIELADETDWQPEAIPLNIVYQDDEIIVINKPAGLVVHPGAGNSQGTLVNALLFHFPELASVPRAGVVHRLDKDTSGILVVARSLSAHNYLVEQLQLRQIKREYTAMCIGVMTSGGTVDAPIGRHPTNRLRMAVRDNGKPAITHYRVLQRFRAHSLLSVNLETGRTHQIRVHMAYIHYPLVGDTVYGGRLKIPPNCNDDFAETLRSFKRQALHATRLELAHPDKRQGLMQWQVEIPDDMSHLVKLAEMDFNQHKKI